MSDSVSTNRMGFKTWLEQNKSEKAASNIKSSIGFLDVLLIKSKCIHSHILQIEDAEKIAVLIENIKRNNGVRIHSKSSRAAFLNALYAYKEYLKLFDSQEENDADDLDDNSVKTVSFTESKTYSYTRPLCVEYFGTQYPIRNWTSLYVQTVKCLLQDYPDNINALINKNIGNRGRIDITDSAGVSAMIAPKELESGLYLETNCSASGIVDKIRQLMDRCSVDHSNIILSYLVTGASNSGATLSISSNGTTDKKAGQGFLDWLVSFEGLTEAMSRSYVAAINNCDSFCREHHIGTGRIYGTETSDELAGNIALLITNEELIEYNCLQHNRVTAALGRYKAYIGILSGKINERKQQTIRKESTAPLSSKEETQILKTLSLPRFEYGFKDDSVELFRFRNSYKEVNGTQCILNDEQLLTAIWRSGFEYDGKIYLVSDEAKKRLKDEVRVYEDIGVCIIYYELLYDSNLDVYFDSKIISAEMLKALLQVLLPKYRYKANYFSLSAQRQTELELIENEIVRVWGGNALKTVDELSVELPLIPVEKLKSTLSQRVAFIWNSIETYTRLDLLNADEDEIDKLVDFTNDQCDKNGRVSLDGLPLDGLRANNPELSETALYNAVYKNIEDLFDRNEKILTKKGTSKDTNTAIIEFCRTQDKCTYERLQFIAKKVAGVARQPAIVEAGNAAMVRVDKNNFVADRFVSFNVDRIDMALDKIIISNFIGMREITTFSIFPFCGYAWNLYLLESYCRRFSKKYQYETRRANSSNSGAVVSKSCLLSYHEIMAHAVARSGMELNEEEVYAFLTATGYMERKRYNDIDALINDAAELREGKK